MQVLTRAAVADRLGCSPDTFRSRRDKLEAAGFPRFDPIIRGYIDADVTAWLSRRRQILSEDADPEQGINWDAI
jgi:hypothetical protein